MKWVTMHLKQKMLKLEDKPICAQRTVDPNNEQQLRMCTSPFWVLLLLDGEPLLCAIIFAAKTMKHECVTGFDPLAEWIGDEQDVEANSGDSKAYPYGPVCNFRGKEVPCFCCNSESGSINGALLTAMLRYIDDKQVCDCSTGLNPFLCLMGMVAVLSWSFLNI